jgi:hypothetical protein
MFKHLDYTNIFCLAIKKVIENPSMVNLRIQVWLTESTGEKYIVSSNPYN